MRSVLSTHIDLSRKSPSDAAHQPVVDIRYGQIGLVQLRIRTTDTGAILDELTGRIATAPNFFRRTAVCIELLDLEKTPEIAEVQEVLNAVRRAGMLSVGLAGSSGEMEAIASALNLPILSAFRPSTFPGAKVQSVQPPPAVQPAQRIPSAEALVAAPPETGLPAMMQHQTVRSGQRLYARNRDLVITAGVGAGAEVIADGCIHIYGALRGRAMGGARDQPGARVFCQEFHAELVSIAGVFRVFETIPQELAGKPVQAWLDGEQLHFARVGG